ncbi:hypothetical protein H4F46_14265 [Pectobacterium brasiliense]|uniref:hypothetical protein n=1 Tax=Pectobacterium brasiliense TaxID=180957 RepID=UPI001968FACD|nr:hypothetical protein [Pectobacterium brasiliense]MBN3116056.1 hypothetical protein [Pectobacterium brasiliense]
MQEIITAIMEWNVIIQGALGSAVFWLFLLLWQKLLGFCSKEYSSHSSKTRKTWLINRLAIINMSLSHSIEDQSHFAAILLYRASRFLFKALMWLVLGLTLNIIFQPVSAIGYIGCLYYLSKGLYVVGGSAANEAKEELIQELNRINKELDNL